MRKSTGGLRLVQPGFCVQQQCRGASRERRAEGSSRRSGITTAGERADHVFAGGSDPYIRGAIVRERGPRVPIGCGSDSHHVPVQGGRINAGAGVFIAGSSNQDNVRVVCTRNRLRQRGRRRGEIETHIHDVCVVLHGVVQRCNDVREIPGPAKGKRLQWKDQRMGRHQMHHSRSHRAVAKCPAGWPVENCGGFLIQDGRALLLHGTGRLA